MKYLIFFLVLTLATSCGGVLETNDEMRKDAVEVITIFCKNQKKQREVAQKMNKLKESGQLPGDDITADLDEINKMGEEYANALQALMNKYKGKERAVHNLLKEGQLNCR